MQLWFVWLTPAPDATNNSIAQQSSNDADVATSQSTVPGADSQAKPFSEGQQQQARTDSQDVLADLLDSKKSLEDKGVTEWAPQQYQAAVALAESGDELYSQQNFAQAIAQYQQSLDGFESINQLIPDVINGLISDGLAAIDAGKTELAKETLNKALKLDQNNIEALNAMGRANNLDQVLDLLRNASALEQDFKTSDELNDITAAVSDYQAAVTLDEKNKTATEGLERSQALEADKRFRVEMTSGFDGLFANRYSSATSAFSRALNINPDDSNAKALYQQALAADKSSSLSSLISSAKRFETNEQWASALGNYEAVLQRDPNQVGAKLGKIRSQARGDLDRQLKEILKDPLALARGTQKDKALSVLNDAKAIAKKGPRLNRQIADIETALNKADVSLKVRFNSDNLSNVRLKKEGAKAIDLGRFTSKNLSLKPGRYVISATRLGFRDERKEIELTPGSGGVLSFSIRCGSTN